MDTLKLTQWLQCNLLAASTFVIVDKKNANLLVSKIAFWGTPNCFWVKRQPISSIGTTLLPLQFNYDFLVYILRTFLPSLVRWPYLDMIWLNIWLIICGTKCRGSYLKKYLTNMEGDKLWLKGIMWTILNEILLVRTISVLWFEGKILGTTFPEQIFIWSS